MKIYQRLSIQISFFSVLMLFFTITFSAWLYLRASLILVDKVDPNKTVVLTLIKPKLTALLITENKLSLIKEFKNIVENLPAELALFDYLIFDEKFNIVIDSTAPETFVELVRAEATPSNYVVITSTVFDKADIFNIYLMTPAMTIKTHSEDSFKFLAIPKVEPRNNPSIKALITSRVKDHLLHFWWLYLVLSCITTITIHMRLRPLKKLELAAIELSQNKIPQQVGGAGEDEIGRLVNAFNMASEKLKSYEEERVRLFSDISHELRTPVTNMLGRIEAYDDGIVKSPDTVIHFTGEQLKGLANIIEDIQLLNSADSKTLSIAPQKINLSNFLSCWLEQSHFNSTFQSQLYCADQVDLVVDPQRLNQVLDNLLSNAMKAKSEDLNIIIKVTKIEMNIEIIFEDDGQGVSLEHLPFIFERLYRVDTSRANNTGGSGLGLSIVKEYIEAHSGNIYAYQANTGGLGIRINLPV